MKSHESGKRWAIASAVALAASGATARHGSDNWSLGAIQTAAAASPSELEAALAHPSIRGLVPEAVLAAIPTPDSNGLYTFSRAGKPLLLAKKGTEGWVLLAPIDKKTFGALDPLGAFAFQSGFATFGDSTDLKGLFGAALGANATSIAVGDGNSSTQDVSVVAFVKARPAGPLGPLTTSKLLPTSTVAVRAVLSSDVVAVMKGEVAPTGVLSLLPPDAILTSTTPGGPTLAFRGLEFGMSYSGGTATLSGIANRVDLNGTELASVKFAFESPGTATQKVLLSSTSARSLPAFGTGDLKVQMKDLAVRGELGAVSSAFAVAANVAVAKASLEAALAVERGEVSLAFVAKDLPPIGLPGKSGTFTLEKVGATLAPEDASLAIDGKLLLRVEGKDLAFRGSLVGDRTGLHMTGTSLNQFTSPRGAFSLGTTTLSGTVQPDGLAVGVQGTGKLGVTNVENLSFCVAGVPGTLEHVGFATKVQKAKAESLFLMLSELLAAGEFAPLAPPRVTLPELEALDVYFLSPRPPKGVNCQMSSIGLGENRVVANAKVPLMGLGDFAFALQLDPAKASGNFQVVLEGNPKELERALGRAIPGYVAKENAAVRKLRKQALEGAVRVAESARDEAFDLVNDILVGASRSLREVRELCDKTATVVGDLKPACAALRSAESELSKAEDALAAFEAKFDDSGSRARSALALLSSELVVKRVRVRSNLGPTATEAELGVLLGLGDFDLDTTVKVEGQLPSTPEGLADLLKSEITLSFEKAAEDPSSGPGKAKANASLRAFSRVQSATEFSGDRAYLFDGAKYLRVGTPAPQVGLLPDMPQLRDGVVRGVDAWEDCSLCYGMDASFRKAGYAYFFKGSEYVRWDVEDDVIVDRTPRTIASLWPNLPADFQAGFDAAVVGGSDFQFVYLFKGNRYVRVTLASKVVQAPRLISDGWNIDAAFDQGVDAAVNFYNGKIYFFKGSEYIRVDGFDEDSGYPKKIEGNWP